MEIREGDHVKLKDGSRYYFKEPLVRQPKYVPLPVDPVIREAEKANLLNEEYYARQAFTKAQGHLATKPYSNAASDRFRADDSREAVVDCSKAVLSTTPRNWYRVMNNDWKETSERTAQRLKAFMERTLARIQNGEQQVAMRLLFKAVNKYGLESIFSENLMVALFEQFSLASNNKVIRREISKFISIMSKSNPDICKSLAEHSYLYLSRFDVGIGELLYALPTSIWTSINQTLLVFKLFPSLFTKPSSTRCIKRLMMHFDFVISGMTGSALSIHRGTIIDSLSKVPNPLAQIHVYNSLLKWITFVADSDTVIGRLAKITFEEKLNNHEKRCLINLLDSLASLSSDHATQYLHMKNSIVISAPSNYIDHKQLMNDCEKSVSLNGYLSSDMALQVVSYLTRNMIDDAHFYDERACDLLKNVEIITIPSSESEIVDLIKLLIDNRHELCNALFKTLFVALSTDHQLALLFHINDLQNYNQSHPHLLKALSIGLSMVQLQNSEQFDSIVITFLRANVANMEGDVSLVVDGVIHAYPKMSDFGKETILRILRSRAFTWRAHDKMRIMSALGVSN